MSDRILFSIGEALIDMIPSGSGCAFADVPAFASAWGCKTLPVQNIFAWNVHFLPNVTF